ncbi:MAG: DinB family protein [Meiothermus sp.]|uniref:DinB family protein n=1 Tax=Meiothermus sp. TaxID=1955249 RepID=UPI0025F9C5F0|nr:DinB family protein [Meiothermus sp.]MCS7068269.1 DinB family protein [Meiothermus sp.]MCX7601864.1 DinB family protein [Meiothermus sp.]
MNNTLLTRFELSLAGLPQIVGPATPEQLRRRSLPEKWSAHENFAHLAHFTLVTQDRMARILQEEAPLIERLKPDSEPAFLLLVERSPEEVLAELKSLRAQLNQQVAALSEAQLDRVGVHSAAGPMPLRAWLELFLVHEAHHLYLAFWRIREVLQQAR